MKFISKYFFRGLLFLTPVSITFLLVLYLFGKVNEAYESSSFRELGLFLFLVMVATGIVGVGYLGSTLIMQPILVFIDNLLVRIPLLGLVYSSLKDVLSAFVGEEKKFDVPVLVELGEGVYKIGFLTNNDLSAIELNDLVSVYLPHSYNFSGNHFLVKRKNIQELDLPSSEVMKLIVSGGVAGYDEIVKKMESK